MTNESSPIVAPVARPSGGLVYVSRDYVEGYVLTLLAVLGTVGILALFAAASGIMRFAGKEQGNPLLKAVVDGAFDGILVTDHAGRVFYANATYLDIFSCKYFNPGAAADFAKEFFKAGDYNLTYVLRK